MLLHRRHASRRLARAARVKDSSRIAARVKDSSKASLERGHKRLMVHQLFLLLSLLLTLRAQSQLA